MGGNIKNLGIVSASLAGLEFDLLSPYSGEPLGSKFKILGYDAPEVIRAGRDYDKVIAEKDKKDIDIEVAFIERRNTLALAALVDWNDFAFDDSAGDEDDIPPTPFSKELAKRILFDPEFVWMVDQIERKGRNRANFTPKSKKS